MSPTATPAILPRRYDLSICATLGPHPRFGGVVRLLAEVVQTTETIVLDVGPNLQVSHSVVYSLYKAKDDSNALEAKIVALEVQGGQAIVKLPQPVERGFVRLSLAFSSKLDSHPEGFYLSDGQDTPDTFALTQFQPFGARRAFPCIDEPGAKAAFSVRFVHTCGTEVIANMPVEVAHNLGVDANTDPDLRFASKVLNFNSLDDLPQEEEWVCHQFALSPAMPTYLVAWALGKFATAQGSYTSISGRVVPIRVLAPVNKEVEKLGRWAAELAGRAMAELERQIGVEYVLPKLDLLACNNLEVRGMENWGLVTAHEQVLLADPGRLGPALFPSARTIVHECAHECGWGNLVTMRDFSELWCNEGSATYIGEVVILSALVPESQAEEMFVSAHRTRGLELDALHSTHPVVNRDIYSGDDLKNDVNSNFDAISYSKGACLLRMVARMIGLPAFLTGARLFLERHAFGSAASDDLWAALAEGTELDIVKVAQGWTHQEGYPLLIVDIERNRRELTVKQQRFLSDGTVDSKGGTWYVPLFLKAISPEGKEVISLPSLALEWEAERTFALPDVPEGTSWVLNSASAGFYRVQYSLSLLQELIPHFTSGGLSDLDRARILEDCSALARSGVGETSALLSLVMGLVEDDSLSVLAEASSVFTHLASLFFEEAPEMQEALHRAAASFYHRKLLQLGFMPRSFDSEETNKVRFLCIAGASMAGEPTAVSKAKEFFTLCQGTSSPLDAVLGTVFMASVRHGGHAEWEQVFAIYLAPPTPAHREAAIAGLTASVDPGLIQRTVDFVFGRFTPPALSADTPPPWHPSQNTVNDSDLLIFCSCMARQPTLIRTLLFNAVQEHWSSLRSELEGSFVWGRLISASLSSLSSDKDLEEVKHFVNLHSEVGVSGARALEVIASSNRWLRACRMDVQDWLKRQGF